MKPYLYSLSIAASICFSLVGNAADTALHVTLQSPSAARFTADVAVIADANVDIRTRFKHVRHLGNELAPQDVRALIAFAKEQGGAEQNIEGLRALKNEVFNSLRHQFFVHDEVTDAFIAIYEDTKQDLAVRDYALQHLGVWYGQEAVSSSGQREKIVETLYHAASMKSSLAGTALLALHRVSSRDEGVAKEKLDEMAIAMARSTDADLATRISSFQGCAERNLTEVLPVVEALAQSAPSTPLRLSAISALSRLGGSSHISILTKLEANESGEVRTSARKALAGLNSRLEHF